MRLTRIASLTAGCVAATLVLGGCASGPETELPPATFVAMQEGPGEEYVIGPLDELTIHVWRNPELGAEKIQVRPDGRITIPLVKDIHSASRSASWARRRNRLRCRIVQT